jgi:hypothetical protein
VMDVHAVLDAVLDVHAVLHAVLSCYFLITALNILHSKQYQEFDYTV